MKVSIGLITSPAYLSKLRAVESTLEDLCSIKYLTIGSNDDIVNNFVDNYDKVDAFIFSGPVLYNYLTKNIDTLNKPCYVMYDNLANVYRDLLSLFMHNPGLKANRVYIDFLNKDSMDEVKYVFPDNNKPYVFMNIPDDADKYNDFVLHNHLKLWEDNKIDLSITRFGMILTDLDQAGIKYHFIQPSVDYLVDLFLEVINAIKLKEINDNKVSTIIIEPSIDEVRVSDNVQTDIQLLTLQRELLGLMKKGEYDLIIQKSYKKIEVYTTYEEIQRLTDQFTTCGIRSFLENSIKSNFSIGYGSGKNISIANRNAFNALNKAKEKGPNHSFYIGEDVSSNGYLSGNINNFEIFKKNPFIDFLSESIGIDSIYLHKIVAHSKKINSNILTSKELSKVLGVTTRSGNRILNKLEDNGYASAHSVKNDSKGRPTKHYQLLFLDSDGDPKYDAEY